MFERLIFTSFRKGKDSRMETSLLELSEVELKPINKERSN